MNDIIFISLLVGLLLSGLVAAWLQLRFIKNGQLGRSRLMALGMIVLTPLIAIWTLFNFGGGFGIGIILYCFAIPAAGLGLIEFLRHVRGLRTFSVSQRWHYGLALVSVLLFSLSPVVGRNVIGGACDAINRNSAAPIITAMETYHQQHNAYPETLENLDLNPLPKPDCAPQTGGQYSASRLSYALQTCRPGGETLLTIYSVAGDWIQRYNFSTENWSSISFLDGACSFLR